MTTTELQDYLRFAKGIFQHVRILDLDLCGYRMASPTGKLGAHENHCYKFWNRDKRCENCISSKVMHHRNVERKFELRGDDIYVVFSKYVEVDGQPRIIEMLSQVDNDMVSTDHGAVPFRDAILKTNHELYHDVQLDILNRRFYEEQMETIEGLNAVAVLDIDFFKQINDHYGHHVGDDVLRQTVACLKQCLRKTDLILRMGGDEFMIAFVNMPEDSFLPTLQRIKKSVQDLRFEGYPEIVINISVGGCSFCRYAPEKVELADYLMYSVKHTPHSVGIRQLED
ncbi:MAG: GGDEF domain-containing protein [Bacteroidales bacterium]|nr:GGDEF domain-containing protein [Bacteroidales bacterium]